MHLYKKIIHRFIAYNRCIFYCHSTKIDILSKIANFFEKETSKSCLLMSISYVNSIY